MKKLLIDPPEVTKSPSDKVTESPITSASKKAEEILDDYTYPDGKVHTGVDMAIKGAGYTVDSLRKMMLNEDLISEARRAEDERVRILAYNDGWARGFFHGLAIGIGIFTVGALYVLWSIMP